MTNAVPVSAIALDLDEPDGEPRDAFTVGSMWIEAVSLGLLVLATILGLGFIQSWLSSPDRWLFTFCISAGLVFALAMATWQGEQSKWRFAFAILAWSVALALIVTSFWAAQDIDKRWTLLAAGLAFSAWCAMRIRGEIIAFALSLGLAVASPAIVEQARILGFFDLLEFGTVTMTSGIADVTGLSNIREKDSIFFEHGVASRFAGIGAIDSALSLLGIGLFCCLARRRNLLSMIATGTASALVWLAVRTVAWVILLHLGIRDGTWYEWSLWMEITCLILGALMVISLDALLSAILQPIPFEFVNLDFPLFSLAWNWLCGLPRLTMAVPQRESDFGPAEDDL
jgi:hypothetical protein